MLSHFKHTPSLYIVLYYEWFIQNFSRFCYLEFFLWYTVRVLRLLTSAKETFRCILLLPMFYLIYCLLKQIFEIIDSSLGLVFSFPSTSCFLNKMFYSLCICLLWRDNKSSIKVLTHWQCFQYTKEDIPHNHIKHFCAQPVLMNRKCTWNCKPKSSVIFGTRKLASSWQMFFFF